MKKLLLLALIFLPQLVSAQVVPSFMSNGLVGYWTMDGRDVVSGRFVNRALSTSDGSPQGIATSTFYSVGRIGQGITLDGTNDYIQLPNNSDYNFSNANNFTISAWVRSTTNASAQAILSTMDAGGNGGFTFQKNNSGNVSMVVRSAVSASAQNGNTVVPVNKWTHVAFTFTGPTSGVFYVNGASDGTATFTVNLASVSSLRAIGQSLNASSPWSGNLDDVRVYNRALSATEIRQLYNYGSATFITPSSETRGLVGHWTFDGSKTTWTSASAGTTRDSSTNTNTGTFTNMASSFNPKEGKIIQGLDFDGSNDYVNVPANASIANIWTATGTVAFWVKPRSAGEADAGFWLSKSSIWTLGARSTHTAGDTGLILAVDFSNTPLWATDTAGITFNKWHHVVVMYNSSNTTNVPTVYVDGNRVNVATLVSPSGTVASETSSSLQLGANSGETRTSDGVMDDVRIYKRELSVTEVLQLYNNGQTIDPTPVGDSRGLFAWWTFDGKNIVNGVVRDASGNAKNGTLVSIATSTFYAPGKIGQGVLFDGVNDMMTASVAPGTAFTISFWIKPTGAPSSYGSIISENGDRGLFYRNNNTITYFDGGDQQDATLVPLNVWTHYTIVSDGATLTFFYNGRFASHKTKAVVSPTFTHIGNDTGSERIQGYLDDLRVYNRAMATSTVLQLYNNGISIFGK